VVTIPTGRENNTDSYEQIQPDDLSLSKSLKRVLRFILNSVIFGSILFLFLGLDWETPYLLADMTLILFSIVPILVVSIIVVMLIIVAIKQIKKKYPAMLTDRNEAMFYADLAGTGGLVGAAALSIGWAVTWSNIINETFLSRDVTELPIGTSFIPYTISGVVSASLFLILNFTAIFMLFLCVYYRLSSVTTYLMDPSTDFAPYYIQQSRRAIRIALTFLIAIGLTVYNAVSLDWWILGVLMVFACLTHLQAQGAEKKIKSLKKQEDLKKYPLKAKVELPALSPKKRITSWFGYSIRRYALWIGFTGILVTLIYGITAFNPYYAYSPYYDPYLFRPLYPFDFSVSQILSIWSQILTISLIGVFLFTLYALIRFYVIRIEGPVDSIGDRSKIELIIDAICSGIFLAIVAISYLPLMNVESFNLMEANLSFILPHNYGFNYFGARLLTWVWELYMILIFAGFIIRVIGNLLAVSRGNWKRGIQGVVWSSRFLMIGITLFWAFLISIQEPFPINSVIFMASVIFLAFQLITGQNKLRERKFAESTILVPSHIIHEGGVVE